MNNEIYGRWEVAIEGVKEREENTMKRESYVYGATTDLMENELTYFGEVWDGEGDGEELLNSGVIATEESRITFRVIARKEDILQSIVKIVSIEEL